MNAVERNNVVVRGAEHDGVPLVFAHGFGCDQHAWNDVAPAFEDDHPVILFDAVGAGDSVLTAYDRVRYGSLDGYAQDVVEILDELGLDDVVFVGHSVAAMVGVLAARRRPELFRNLVLVAPSPRYLNDEGYVGGFEREDIDEMLEALAANYFGWAHAMAPAIVGNADRPEIGEWLTSSFCRTDPEIAEHFARVTFLSDNRADLPRVATPSLVLQCRSDVLAPDSVGAFVEERMPNARLLRLEATGHCPNLSSPGEVIAAIRSVL
jgi:sigma-B regulation protein RsbQ